ncbi:MAG: hypothetical protein BroJett029_00060 [Alphaproteobacteria bacterium]|nr:MAG: hypothetical protein BroJett029_00060 [Alphaproteobacteria bacterium]
MQQPSERQPRRDLAQCRGASGSDESVQVSGTRRVSDLREGDPDQQSFVGYRTAGHWDAADGSVPGFKTETLSAGSIGLTS